jgi:hypothetical protein
MIQDNPNLPTDVQDAINLREYVEELRTVKGYIVDKLAEPPLHVPGCDDPHGKFDWYVMIDPSQPDKTKQTLGYFHVKPGIDL